MNGFQCRKIYETPMDICHGIAYISYLEGKDPACQGRWFLRYKPIIAAKTAYGGSQKFRSWGRGLFVWLGQGGGSRLQVVMFGLS